MRFPFTKDEQDRATRALANSGLQAEKLIRLYGVGLSLEEVSRRTGLDVDEIEAVRSRIDHALYAARREAGQRPEKLQSLPFPQSKSDHVMHLRIAISPHIYSRLTVQEQNIVHWCYENRPLHDVATRLGVTADRARQRIAYIASAEKADRRSRRMTCRNARQDTPEGLYRDERFG